MGKNSTSTTSTAKRRRTYTDEQRARNAEYLRRYRAEHPDAARRWRETYILRKAEKLRAQAEAEAALDGGSGGGH